MNTLQKIKQSIVDGDQAAAEQALLDHVKPYVDLLEKINKEIVALIKDGITPELPKKAAEDLVIGYPYRVIGKTTEGFSFKHVSDQMVAAGLKYLTYKGNNLFEDDRNILSIYLNPEDVVEYELTAEDLVVGERYVPVKKSIAAFDRSSLNESPMWREACEINQPFLYYNGIWACPILKQDVHLFGYLKGVDGDYFLPSDVKPYYEN